MHKDHFLQCTSRSKLVPSLVLALTILANGCGDGTPEYRGGDIEAFRADLKDSVERGDLTLEEAHVELAIATKQAKRSASKKKRSGSKIGAYGAKLKQQLKDGEITEEEALAKFEEFRSQLARDQRKESAKEPEKTGDSGKEDSQRGKEKK